jgi:hypothetical protein
MISLMLRAPNSHGVRPWTGHQGLNVEAGNPVPAQYNFVTEISAIVSFPRALPGHVPMAQNLPNVSRYVELAGVG